MPLAESRARFEEAYDIITRAWTEEVFSYSGKFWSYKDVALWPRPVQRPHPPVWIPVTGSKESIEFAGKHDIVITPGLRPGGLQEDMIRYYAKCLARNGRRVTPDHLSLGINAYVADSKAQAVKEIRALFPLFQPHPLQPRQFHRDEPRPGGRLHVEPIDRLCAAREPARGRARARRISAT